MLGLELAGLHLLMGGGLETGGFSAGDAAPSRSHVWRHFFRGVSELGVGDAGDIFGYRPGLLLSGCLRRRPPVPTRANSGPAPEASTQTQVQELRTG